MESHGQPMRVAGAVLRERLGRMPRRDALRLLAGLGLSTAGAAALGIGAVGAGAPRSAVPATGGLGGHLGRHAALLGQDAAPVATPPLGARPDGTRVWRVRVAGMNDEGTIETQGFFPREITINAGDAIFFAFPDPPGFHTVTFLDGHDVPPLMIPDPDGATPPAGSPPGTPRLIINPDAAFPVGGTAYPGAGYLNSGLDVLRQPGDPFLLAFPKAGTFHYQCIPHGVVMKATVVVQEAGSALPDDQAAVDARAGEERAALLAAGLAEIAKYGRATSTPRPDGTTLWEVAAGVGEGQARVPQFLPNALAIKAGDTVRWVNHSKTEPHTVTFLDPGAEQPEDVVLEPQPSGPPKLVQNPLTLFPQGGRVYDGRGYVNSGFMGELNGRPLPGTHPFELTFTTPGDYPYFCILHGSGPEGPGMAGRIAVR